MLFYLELFCILIFLVAIYQCRSGKPIEKYLDLALNFHVRMMIDSLVLSKRTDGLDLSESRRTKRHR